MAEGASRDQAFDIKTHLALMAGVALVAWSLLVLAHWLFVQASGHPSEFATATGFRKESVL